jgi:hypothetical protein
MDRVERYLRLRNSDPPVFPPTGSPRSPRHQRGAFFRERRCAGARTGEPSSATVRSLSGSKEFARFYKNQPRDVHHLVCVILMTKIGAHGQA